METEVYKTFRFRLTWAFSTLGIVISIFTNVALSEEKEVPVSVQYMFLSSLLLVALLLLPWWLCDKSVKKLLLVNSNAEFRDELLVRSIEFLRLWSESIGFFSALVEISLIALGSKEFKLHSFSLLLSSVFMWWISPWAAKIILFRWPGNLLGSSSNT